LHELDKELEKLGQNYVRYADDFSIYTKTKSAARKMGNNIFLFLKNKLKLPINREKSGIRKPVHFELLGYKFVPTYIKGDKGQYQLVVSEKSWLSLKQRLKSATRKTSPHSFDVRIHKLKEIQRGWVNYFRLASMHGKLRDVDDWVRNRLRYCILRQAQHKSGMTGRNPNGKGKTLYVWGLTMTMLMLGADQGKVVGQLLKALSLALRSLLIDSNGEGMFHCWTTT